MVYDILAIVVNYNSMRIFNIERLLIAGLDKLSDLLSLKLVLVDNSSSDGSFEKLSALIECYDIDAAVIRLSRNFGFTRAVNIAYRYAVKQWGVRYLALLNNDLVIVPRNMVEVAEFLEYNDVAGVQGTIMQMQNPQLIDNAGFLIDQYGLTYPVCRGYPFECAKLYTPSYLSGACSLYKTSAIDTVGGKPFDDAIESYYDDKYLGLKLWSKGYKLLHIPLITTYHLGSASYSNTTSVVFKGTKWFKGIVQADLIPASLRGSLAVKVVACSYALAAVVASTAVGHNYVKSFSEALKETKSFVKYKCKKDNFQLKNIQYIKSFIPLRHHLKGIII